MDYRVGKNKKYIIGIDATSIRDGGGITHLVELLKVVHPEKYGIQKVYVWGNSKILSVLDVHSWMIKVNPPELDQGLLLRSLWQHRQLVIAAKKVGCDVLFVPGGSSFGKFMPVVTMSRNLLPFEVREFVRYGWSLITLRSIVLRVVQSRGFCQASGVIFLTAYAKRAVLKVTGKISGETTIVPHGINPRFKQVPKLQRNISEYHDKKLLRLIYVSIVDQYKHQWHVVKAVHQLRMEGFPLHLDLIGAAYLPSLKRLKKIMVNLDPKESWVKYHGKVPYSELPQKYADADLGIFASTCENMPNILLETMAAGLPIACSNRGPMREVLQDGGLYFDSEKPDDIAKAIRDFLVSPELRAEKAQRGFELVQKFQWTRCADETFRFLIHVIKQHQGESIS